MVTNNNISHKMKKCLKHFFPEFTKNNIQVYLTKDKLLFGNVIFDLLMISCQLNNVEMSQNLQQNLRSSFIIVDCNSKLKDSNLESPQFISKTLNKTFYIPLPQNHSLDKDIIIYLNSKKKLCNFMRCRAFNY